MTELTLLIRLQFSFRINCYEMLWLYVDKSRLQGIPICRAFTVIIGRRTLYLFISSVYVKNWNHNPRNKFHAIPRFPTGSFAVRDHLWSNLGIISGLGIICSRGSFAALYRTPSIRHIGGPPRSLQINLLYILQSKKNWNFLTSIS